MSLDRRSILRLSAVSLAGIAAGCSDGGDGPATTEETPASGTTDSTEPTETASEQGEVVSTTETAAETSQPPTETRTPDTQTQTATPTPVGPAVEMEGVEFAPMELSVEPGTTVRWVNRDGVPHDVVADQFNSGATRWEFESARIGNGETVEYTFEETGTYEYYCSVHGAQSMCGVVLVGGASRAGSLPCE